MKFNKVVESRGYVSALEEGSKGESSAVDGCSPADTKQVQLMLDFREPNS